MKSILYFLLLTCLSLHANESPMVIDSALAQYNGDKIILSGQVSIEHALGKILANQIEITPDPSKKFKPKNLQLNEAVNVQFNDGSILTCTQAQIDCDQLSGQFQGNVEYTEATKPNNAPLRLKSEAMEVQLGSHENKINIEQAKAHRNVQIDFHKHFLAKAHLATYQRQGSQGHIVLKPIENGLCEVSNLHGDFIQAREIAIDEGTHIVTFQTPAGVINQDQIHFSADTLLWDDKNMTLTMLGQINIDQPGMGQLLTHKQLVLQQTVKDGKKQLLRIDCSGETVLKHFDQEKDREQTIYCSGPLSIDHQKFEAVLESAVNRDDAQKKQIVFEDFLGEIHADKAIIHYAYEGKSLAPSEITLVGNVKILNYEDDSETGHLQYAIAHNLVYTLKNKELVLAGKGSQRVLFYDRVVETLHEALKVEPTFERTQLPFLHPGKAAAFEGGWVGELRPERLEGEWGVFEVDLPTLFARVPERLVYEDVITFPALRQDLAFTVPEGVTAAELAAAAREAAGPELHIDEQDLVELGEHQCYVRLSSRGERLPTFSVHLDPPLVSDPRLRAWLARASARRFGRDAELVEAERRATLARVMEARARHVRAVVTPPQPDQKPPPRNEHRAKKKRRQPEAAGATSN